MISCFIALNFRSSSKYARPGLLRVAEAATQYSTVASLDRHASTVFEQWLSRSSFAFPFFRLLLAAFSLPLPVAPCLRSRPSPCFFFLRGFSSRRCVPEGVTCSSSAQASCHSAASAISVGFREEENSFWYSLEHLLLDISMRRAADSKRGNIRSTTGRCYWGRQTGGDWLTSAQIRPTSPEVGQNSAASAVTLLLHWFGDHFLSNFRSIHRGRGCLSSKVRGYSRRLSRPPESCACVCCMYDRISRFH